MRLFISEMIQIIRQNAYSGRSDPRWPSPCLYVMSCHSPPLTLFQTHQAPCSFSNTSASGPLHWLFFYSSPQKASWLIFSFPWVSSQMSPFQMSSLTATDKIASPLLSFLISFYFFFFLQPHLWYMEVLRATGQIEAVLPADTTATAMPAMSCICNLHHSSQQCRIRNWLSEARDGTCILTDTMFAS